MVNAYSKFGETFSAAFTFLIFLGFWQIYYLISATYSFSVLSLYFLYSTVYLACFGVITFLIKIEGSTFESYGFKGPVNLNKALAFSVCCVAVYCLITLLPGMFTGYALKQMPIAFSYFTFAILNAPLVSIVEETVFRGFIFKKLFRNFGFLTSLYLSSLMYSLSTVSILSLSYLTGDALATYFFNKIALLFAEGLFLGYLFYKLNWSLLGPIVFRIGILLYVFLGTLSALSPWWMDLSFKMIAYGVLIVLTDIFLKEPGYLRRIVS